MPSLRISLLRSLLLGILLNTTHVVRSVSAQEGPPLPTIATAPLQKMAAAFSRGRLVSHVQLSGNATWHAGGSEDTGTVTLATAIDGPSTMTLTLSSAGSRTETQTGVAANAVCQWSGADGVMHGIPSASCLAPTTWFLPTFFLQPILISNAYQYSVCSIEPVGSASTPLLHLQSKLLLSGTESSTFDLGLDPASYLPAVSAYSVHPDNGAPVPIAIEIRYFDYRSINGVQVPFHIERYMNGALQLDIVIDSAEAN